MSYKECTNCEEAVKITRGGRDLQNPRNKRGTTRLQVSLHKSLKKPSKTRET